MAVDQARLQTDQSYRADLRNQGYFVGSENGQVYAQQGGNPATGQGGPVVTGSGVQQPGTTVQAQSSALGAGINSLLGAIASGNKQAFDEAVRQFNQTFGLDKDKFAESIRQYNEGLGISQAGLTGTYQGAPTQQAQAQAANFLGTYQGQPTLAAQQQAYAQQLGAINAAAALQANPFRQQQVIGQLGRLLGGQSVPGFQAPNTVAGVGTQGGNTQGGMGYMSQLISDIQGGSGGTNSVNADSVLAGIPTPNKLNSSSFLRASPSTQNMLLQGMQERYGLDPADSLAQIKATLPAFTAPSTFGTIKG